MKKLFILFALIGIMVSCSPATVEASVKGDGSFYLANNTIRVTDSKLTLVEYGKDSLIAVSNDSIEKAKADSIFKQYLNDPEKRAEAIAELKTDFELIKDAKENCNDFWCWFWVVIKILSGAFIIALINWLVRLIPSKNKNFLLILRLLDLIGYIGKLAPNRRKDGLKHD